MDNSIRKIQQLNEAELRKHRCCFTGHRPEKLMASESVIKAALAGEIDLAIRDGFTTFISGVARGVDLWAAELVLDRRAGNPAIKLICASPYKGFERRWSAEWQSLYTSVMARADLIRFIGSGHTRSIYQTRNEWMVDRSARVIAVFNGESGGTMNTIQYAQKTGIQVRLLGE